MVIIIFGINLRKKNKLVDLKVLRNAPQLSNIQVKKILEELETNIFYADCITIGIIAPCDIEAIEALQSISKNIPQLNLVI